MSKNVWVQPQTAVQQFVANEYVAACGDINKVYKFVCDASWGIEGYGGTVYLDSNKNGRFDSDDERLGTYHPCTETHEASTMEEFPIGFLTGYIVHIPKKVRIWTDGGTNIHCTTKINMDEWETAKS